VVAVNVVCSLLTILGAILLIGVTNWSANAEKNAPHYPLLGSKDLDSEINRLLYFFSETVILVPAGKLVLDSLFAVAVVIFTFISFEMNRSHIQMRFVPFYPLLLQFLSFGFILPSVFSYYEFKRSVLGKEVVSDLSFSKVVYLFILASVFVLLHICITALNVGSAWSAFLILFLAWPVIYCLFQPLLRNKAPEHSPRIRIMLHLIFGGLFVYSFFFYLARFFEVVSTYSVPFADANHCYSLQFLVVDGLMMFISLLFFIWFEEGWKAPLGIAILSVVLSPGATISLYIILRNERFLKDRPAEPVELGETSVHGLLED